MTYNKHRFNSSRSNDLNYCHGEREYHSQTSGNRGRRGSSRIRGRSTGNEQLLSFGVKDSRHERTKPSAIPGDRPGNSGLLPKVPLRGHESTTRPSRRSSSGIRHIECCCCCKTAKCRASARRDGLCTSKAPIGESGRSSGPKNFGGHVASPQHDGGQQRDGGRRKSVVGAVIRAPEKTIRRPWASRLFEQAMDEVFARKSNGSNGRSSISGSQRKGKASKTTKRCSKEWQ